jgi:hypothetical protein
MRIIEIREIQEGQQRNTDDRDGVEYKKSPVRSKDARDLVGGHHAMSLRHISVHSLRPPTSQGACRILDANATKKVRKIA